MRYLPFHSTSRFALGMLALLFLPPAWAEDPVAEFNAIKRASLKGIESVDVIVLAAPEESRCPGLPDAQVQTDVEDRLRLAGIQLGPGSASYLFVSVVSIPALPDMLHAFLVSIDLQQVVRLRRDARIVTFGATWHLGGMGVAATSRLPEYPRQMLAAIVDRFISDFREENPNL